MKTQRLIAAALKRQGRLHYVPIDVSPSALEESARRLTRQFPSLRVTGYVADYRRGLERIMARAEGSATDRLPGLEPGQLRQGAGGRAAGHDRPDDAARRPSLLLGTDLAKERAVLEAAYDDAQGVTAAFNLNLLRRINRELGADFRGRCLRAPGDLPRRTGAGSRCTW